MEDDQTTIPPAVDPAATPDPNAGGGVPPVDPAGAPIATPAATPNEEAAKDALDNAPLPTDPADTSVNVPVAPPSDPAPTTLAKDPMAPPPVPPAAPADPNAGPYVATPEEK